jgi:hypothetical protein
MTKKVIFTVILTYLVISGGLFFKFFETHTICDATYSYNERLMKNTPSEVKDCREEASAESLKRASYTAIRWPILFFNN